MSELAREPIDWGYVRASIDKQKSTLVSQRDELIERGVKPEYIFVYDATTGKKTSPNAERLGRN